MIYAIVQMRIDNPDKLAAYREVAGEALARHGGAVLAVKATPDALEGNALAPDMAGVLSFPDRDSAFAWVNDPDLEQIHALRNEIGESNIKLIA